MPQSYDNLSKTLHWVMAIIIIYASVTGFLLHLVEKDSALFSFISIMNMSLGTIITPLFFLRWLWSHFRDEPHLPQSIPAFQQKIARFMHHCIYTLIFVVIFSGFLMLDRPYPLFWVFIIDNMVTDPSVNAFFTFIHNVTSLALFIAVILHALAALKHHFVSRNGVLKMMLWY